MPSSEDTEITLGTGKLVVLFFGLVAICATFFALGYSLGKKSEVVATASSGTPTMTTGVKPNAAGNHGSPASAVESAFRADHPDQPAPSGTASNASDAAASAQAAAPADSANASGAYSVQVAAVSHQEDADALASALRKKQYSAVVVPGSGADKFFHVQVGPFSDLKDAEEMKARLVSDGYNPIVKK